MKIQNVTSMAAVVTTVFLSACGQNSGSSPTNAPAAVPLPPEIVIPGGVFVPEVPTKIRNARLTGSDKCAVDSINAKQLPKDGSWNISKADGLRISGWAVDGSTNAAVPEVFVRLQGASQSYHAVSTSRGQRRDVSMALGVPESLNVGVELRASLEHVSAGSYKISLIQISSSAGSECHIPGSVTIK